MTISRDVRPLDVALAHRTARERGPFCAVARRIAALLTRTGGEDRRRGRVAAALRRRRLALGDRLGPRTSLYPGDASAPPDAIRALLVSHDLDAAGAPKIVYELALLLRDAGYLATVLSPFDGPFRRQLIAAGIDVIVDRDALAEQSPILAALVGSVDIALCNTVVTAAAVRTLAPRVPTFWYLHEVSLLEERLRGDPRLAPSLGLPHAVWAGSELSAALARPHRADVEIVPYGLDPLSTDVLAPRPGAGVKIGVFGSIEARKGQDLAMEALSLLPEAERGRVDLTFYGRVLSDALAADLRERAAGLPGVTFGGELDPRGYLAAMLGCDAVLVPSRTDTLPLVSLDALGAARVLMCTPTTGTSAYLDPGVSGFVSSATDARAIAAMLSEAVARTADWPAIGEAGRKVFARSFSKDVFAHRVREAFAGALPGRVE